MKKPKFRLLIAATALFFAMTACSLPSLLTINPTSQVTDTPAAETAVSTTAPDTSFIIPDEVMLQDALVQLYQNVSPGVVSIQVYSDTVGSGLGSGFVIDKEGHIVTNYHVVQGATEIEVHFQSGLKVYGQVIGQDLDSDIAVIQVDVDPEVLVPLPIGDSDQVRVGQSVVAIGNPFGLTSTMTVGIVSARGRTLESIRQTGAGNYFSAGDLIQTDAAINPGNSGGPLLNLNGEVIGINRAIQTDGNLTATASNIGIGFAVSSNILSMVLPALTQGESYSYPYLGLSSLPSLTLTEADLLGLPQATGAYILEIVPGGPADQAGLRAGDEATGIAGVFAGGDLIISVDGHDVLQFSQLLSYMMLNKQPGDEMTVTILRDGQEMTLTVILGERPPDGG